MATRTSKNNILAGTFVVASILLAVAVAIALSDVSSYFQSTASYAVRFSISDGAEGLKPGSLIKMGGQPIGKVTGWRFEEDPSGSGKGGAQKIAVLVEISMRSDLRIRRDAVVMLLLPLLGSNSSLNIPHPGTAEELRPGDVLTGMLAPPSFLAQAGYGPEQARALRDIIGRVDRLTASVETEWDPKIKAMLEDLRTVAADARAKWPQWSDRISSTLTSVDDASGKFAPIVDDVKSGVADAKALLADNRPRIDATLKDAQELAHKANTEGWDSVKAMLDRGRQGIDDFADVAERASTLVREDIPQLKVMIANARLASDQLKLTTAEVRAAPWKLLSKPTGRKDLENEALYDAARAYSTAVSDLRAASEALRAVTESAGATSTGADKAAVQELVNRLDAAFKSYQDAEKNFLEKLTK